MKYVSIVLAVVFIFFAALQYNDPDPVVWISFYLYASAMSFMVFYNKANIYALGVGAMAYLAGIFYSWPSTFSRATQEMSIMDPSIEGARETMGLGICLFTMLMYLTLMYTQKQNAKNNKAGKSKRTLVG